MSLTHAYVTRHPKIRIFKRRYRTTHDDDYDYDYAYAYAYDKEPHNDKNDGTTFFNDPARNEHE